MAIAFTIYHSKSLLKTILLVCIVVLVASVSYSEESNIATEWLSIGNDYFYGNNGKTKDFVKAFDYYDRAAKLNLAAAQYNLGVMYLNGYGCTKNLDEAVRWFKIAANQGYADAQYSLGVMYRDGFGDTRNYHESIDWFRKAANQGSAEAQFELGLMLVKYFPKSKYEEAMSSFTKAAEQGNVAAQTYLGHLYYLEDKYEYALKWSMKAAQSGNSFAQGTIGRMYFYGKGVEQNYLKAYMWFTLSPDKNTLFIRKIEENLPKDEIEKAKKMTDTWKQDNLEVTNTHK